MRNLKLLIEYEGTAYYGWQIQPGVRTVQGVIEEKLSLLLQHPVRLKGASRTDKGVHALGQVANFFTSNPMDLSTIQRALNALLPPDIVIKGVEEVPADFHARFSAKSKVYEYRILNRPFPSALWRRFCWHIPQPLELEVMRRCAEVLIGEHDFSSFRLSGDKSSHSWRRVLRAQWRREEELMVFEIEANAFLRGMVRGIVGTLVEVGRGKISPEGFLEILEARDRRKAAATAPPQGLILKEIRY